MTLADVERLFASWKDYPPVRDLVAAYMGFKPKSSAPEVPKMNADDMRRLMAMTGGRVVGMGPYRGK